ncbi:MAG: relaxase/mobilization nuclease domain-containing protein [Burkholderiaceae bacterium]|nr:relaxase/mobilization nuclease domain-containing protein [Burkholderiaceae bacterium]
MIPTVLKSDRTSAPSARFRRVVEYVGRDDEEARAKGQKPLTVESCGVFDMDLDCATPEDRETLWQIMSADAAQAKYKGSPVYHFDVSWMEDEHPTREQLESAARHFIDGLGFGNCQTFWAVHRDTDHDHLHIVVNKVIVQDGTCIVAEKPRFDYRVLARLAREVEIEQGWEHAPGHYVAIEQAGGKKIMRMKEAAARGLWDENWQAQKLSRNALRAEHNLGGGDSFQAWVCKEPAQALYKTVHQPGATWTQVHATLARYGVAIEAKGSGLVVTTALDDGRVLAAKASQIGKWASKSALQKRFGAYQPPAKSAEIPKNSAQQTYQETMRAQRAGEKYPKKSAQESEKESKKDARAAARKKLAERFEREQNAHARLQQRAALRERHQAERKALKASLAGERRKLFQTAKAQHRRVTPVELALHARQRALQLEKLQKQQRAERLALSRALSKSVTWRAWLEQQAQHGDAAAQAALRGIRYQEQRKKRQQANAIEDATAQEREEQQIKEQPIRVLTVERLRVEIGRRQQWVVYKSADGQTQMVDQGHRIVVKNLYEDTLEAALRVACAKFHQITITGTSEFREHAARRATRLGISVLDADLQKVVQDEREKVNSKFGKSQIVTPSRKSRVTQRDIDR